ncbi:pilus assembly protein [Defluviimonas sp. WL0024]|uniref:Pilus assembly protein n=2 Tax=Albidovulum TaxID=205889 RepID=A0ABT3J452_9RHOB|nr:MULTISPECIES: TadE/TadG family type IV pilus assembly protein [Defluviimonas]MCU9847841.1 pilus assembly protein [Defluviimonas sp. WL0024]MCW3782446.1 pilus assembly protein [Defluviimonas salinarum]
MTQRNHLTARLLSRLARDERGTTMVELAIVLPFLLLLLLALVDFGRMGGEYVMTSKAVQWASRLAVVRPPACPGVPTFNARGPVAGGTIPPKFGTACSAGSNICVNPGTISCTASTANPTVQEIWTAISPMMPNNATPANLRFSYAYDPALGFLGGPYVPIVTVEVQNLNFNFVTPLGGFSTLYGTVNPQVPPNSLPFPAISTSLPGEDLDLGTNG